MNRFRVGTSWISRWVALLITVLFALYWPAASRGKDHVLLLIHIGVLVSGLLLGVLWSGAKFTRAELNWAAAFAAYLFVLFIVSFTASYVDRALINWVRMSLLPLISFGLGRALCHRGTSRALGLGCKLAAVFSALFICWLYWTNMGLHIPSYADLRVFKGLVSLRYHVALNPLASSSVFLCIISVATLRPTRMTWAAVGFVLFVACLMTGSRAPIALLAGSLFILVLINMVRSPLRIQRF